MADVTSTSVYWDVDGTPLQTFAYNIATLGGSRAAPPPLRGQNLKIPRRRGQRYMPKVVDSNTLSFGMWAIGANTDGSAPTSATQAATFWKNWHTLRRLLWTPNREFLLTKRWYDDTTGLLNQATGYGQFADGLNPEMHGQASGIFTVDIEMADPYFYGQPVAVPLSNGSNTVTIPGDDSTVAVAFHINGARVNPRINNASLNNTYVQYQGSLGSGDYVDIDVDRFTATTTPSGTSAFSSNGSIRHAGDDYWFRLRTGSNTIQVTSDSGIGGITMTYTPVYIP